MVLGAAVDLGNERVGLSKLQTHPSTTGPKCILRFSNSFSRGVFKILGYYNLQKGFRGALIASK